MSSIWKSRYQRSRHLIQKTIRNYNEKPALKAYLEIFLTLIAISLFGLFAIRPTIKTIGTLLKEIEAKETTLSTMEEKIENLKTARDLYSRERERIALVDEAIPPLPSPDALALQIEELARINSVEIAHLNIEDSKILGEPLPDPDSALTLTLGVSGNYQNLTSFAADIESLRRPIKYDGIIITAADQSGSDRLNMSLQGLLTPYGEGGKTK